jgi:uncharacterized protein involved in exopolysaccharide biosynthesis
MENKEEKNTHLNIILLMVQWWKVLVAVALSAALLSAGISLLIKPKFQSSVIIMPTASNAISQMIMGLRSSNEDLDATQFGDDIKIDQMLQILNSGDMKKHLIEQFNLLVHYDIDTNTKYWKTKIYNAVKDNCTFSRTRFMGVQISVLDEDPQFAADMANEIADYYDVLKRTIIKQRSQQAFVILQDEMNEAEACIALLVDSLSKIMSYGVYDYESQSERLIQQYAKDVSSGNTAGMNRIKAELQTLEKWAPIYVSVRDRILYLKENQMLLQEQYQNMRVDADYKLPQKFIVEAAVASDKKAYPKRMMIVLLATFCSLALALLLIIAQQSLKQGYASLRKDLLASKKE